MKQSLIFINQTIALISYYNFDLGEYTAQEFIIKWSKKYPHFWLPLAVLEAIYQGRLKAISTEQILNLWHRQGIPCYQFNHEFASLVSDNIYICDKSLFFVEDRDEEENTENIANEYEVEKMPENQEEKNISTAIVVYKSPIKIFEPIEDYSHCYSKLKSLAKMNNFQEINDE